MRDQATVVAGDDGAPTLLGFLSEITQRKHAEMALRASEERLRTVLSGMPVMLDAFDAQGRLAVWNAECERVTGYSAAELIGRDDVIAQLYPDPVTYRTMAAEWARRGGDFRNWELALTRKDGAQRVVAWSNISAYLPVAGWAIWGVGVDVTDRTQIEQLLWQHARLQEALAGALRALHGHGPQALNTAAAQLCRGVGAGQVLVWERTAPAGLRLVAAAGPDGTLDLGAPTLAPDALPAPAPPPGAIPALALRTGVDLHYYLLPIRWPKTDWGLVAIGMPVATTLSPDGLTIATTVVEMIQTTLRRWCAAAALEESERRLRLTVAVAQIGTFELTIATGTLTISAIYAQLLGMGDAVCSAPLDAILERVHPDDRQAILDQFSHTRASGIADQMAFRVVRPDGSIRWLHGSGQVLFSPDGTPERAVGVVVDNTAQRAAQAALQQLNADLERRVAARTQALAQTTTAMRQEIAERTRAEAALHESQRFLDRVLRTSPSHVTIFDATTHQVIFSNVALTALLGYPAAELEHMGSPYPLEQLIHPDDWAVIPVHLQQQRAMVDDQVVEHEFRMRHADGSWRWFITRAVVFSRDGAGGPAQILGQVFEITARKEAEACLSAALRQMATLNAGLQRTETLLRTIMTTSPAGPGRTRRNFPT